MCRDLPVFNNSLFTNVNKVTKTREMGFILMDANTLKQNK